MSRVQLSINVSDLDTAVAFYTRLLGTARPSSGPGTPTSRWTTRRSSWS